jgi:nicotinamidase-related amidase
LHFKKYGYTHGPERCQKCADKEQNGYGPSDNRHAVISSRRGVNRASNFGLVNGADAEEDEVRRGKEVVPVIRKLLSAFRETEVCVAVTVFGSLTEDGSDLVPYVRPWNRECEDKLGFPSIVSVRDPGNVIMPVTSPLPNEPVIGKTVLGAFNFSVIDHVLKHEGD